MKEVEFNSIISSEYYSRLNTNSSSGLEGIISKEEALSALKLMKNNNSPGSDGFNTKFYSLLDHLKSISNSETGSNFNSPQE